MKLYLCWASSPIPAGGLFTGAEVPKTVAEAALYGGVAGAAFDPCYHAFRDNLIGAGQNVALYNLLREDTSSSATSTSTRWT